MEDRTVLVVTYRFFTFQWMDCIVVLDHGRVADNPNRAYLFDIGDHQP